MQWLAPVQAALRSLAAIWRRQDGFGRVLMAVGATNMVACLLLGLGLLVFSVMPWRGALGGMPTTLRVPTSAPTTPRPSPVPSLTPSPTLSPTPSATPKPSRTPTAAPSPRPKADDIKVTVRLSDDTPRRNSRVTVFASITKDGRPIPGVPMTATWRLKNSTSQCDDRSNLLGWANCTLRLGNVQKGTKGEVQVTFSYEGSEYSATASFTVR